MKIKSYCLDATYLCLAVIFSKSIPLTMGILLISSRKHYKMDPQEVDMTKNYFGRILHNESDMWTQN